MKPAPSQPGRHFGAKIFRKFPSKTMTLLQIFTNLVRPIEIHKHSLFFNFHRIATFDTLDFSDIVIS